MLKKTSTYLKLIFSKNPKDKVFLKKGLRRTPLLGPALRGYDKLNAHLFQRTPQDYVKMQKKAYELYAAADTVTAGNIDGDFVVGSWKQHNEWPDYDEFLMKYVPRDQSWIAIDYGCGPGRNLRRWSPIFKRIDGVDISQKNLNNALIYLKDAPGGQSSNLYLTEGMDCGTAPTNHYDFAMSTICLQHICVYKVRFSILKNLFECLKPGGRISIQMGYGVPSPNTVNYHEDHVTATDTNRAADVAITSPDEVRKDLEKIGFSSFEHWIRPTGPGDTHPNWIFFTAVRPEN